jgi:pantoate--beta-alanine ligase
MSGDIAKESGARHDVQVFETVADMRACVAKWRADGLTVAVVPTMGFLHRAHVAMIEAAQAQCDRVIVTIFVNPKQFGENEDFDTYPRDLDGDLAQLRAVGANAAFVPAPSEMYPPGFSTAVLVAGLTDGLCGASRPGHFDGVSTVVTKLLLQCQADDAMFGEKDYQQLQVVRRMVRDLDIPVRICPVPTVRDDDGLAISSRNVKLSADQRAIAPALYRELRAAAARIADGGSIVEAEAAGRAALDQAGFDKVDYFEARDAETLAPLVSLDREGRLFAAAFLGEARLIDNVAIGDV